MKVVILAGGYGARIGEEVDARPKPMVEIGGVPMLWHIMKLYAAHGLTEFVVCLGYKGYMIKEYFAHYVLHRADVTVDLAGNDITYHASQAEPWLVTLVDTGLDTRTGGRLKRAARYLDHEPFCMTYGDVIADVDVTALVAFHKARSREATATVVRPSGRFGATTLQEDRVVGFAERPGGAGDYINGGFYVLQPAVLRRIAGDATEWEEGPLEGLARDRQLSAYQHDGFWQKMDTLREKRVLDSLWESGTAPWKIWD